MADIHRCLFGIVMNPDWSHATTAAIDVTLPSRYDERFADHLVDVEHRIVCQCVGLQQD